VKTAEMLGCLQGDANDALENLRDLARGVYPPLLADKGLRAALEAQARKSAVSVRIEGDGMGRYPAEVEATVYFCALEALQNVAKYADARNATVSLVPAEGGLTFVVSDDGRGFDPGTTASGSGLQGMRDRVDALGGHLSIESAPGRGTTVTGHVPID
jgi:signal transduction histidine kinase